MKKNLLTMAITLLLCALLPGLTAFAADTTLDLEGLFGVVDETNWSFDRENLTLKQGTFALTGDGGTLTKITIQTGATLEDATLAGNIFCENYGVISGGTYSVRTGFVNRGSISGGSFRGNTGNALLRNGNGGTITDGTFAMDISNEDDSGGAVSGGSISGGTFKNHVFNGSGCTISGGTFEGIVSNHGTITGGTFTGEVRMGEGGALSGVTPANLTYQLRHNVDDALFGSAYLAAGAEYTLTAATVAGKYFDHWELDGLTVADATQPTITFHMPANYVSAEAIFKDYVTYNLWVGGVQMTGEYPYLPSNSGTPQATAPASGGYAYYDGTTLVLNNYSYTGPGYEAWTGSTMAIYSDGNLAIELVGTSSLLNTNGANGNDYAVYVKGTLSIDGKGSGVLYVGDNNGKGSVDMEGGVSVKDCTLYMGTRSARIFSGARGSNLSISGCTISGARRIGEPSEELKVSIADSTISCDRIGAYDLIDVKNSVVTAEEFAIQRNISVSDSTVLTKKFGDFTTFTAVNSAVTIDGEPDEDDVFKAEGDVVLTHCKAVIASRNHDGSNPEEFKANEWDYKYIKILPCNSVTVNAGDGGSASAGAMEACLDEVVTLTATPNAGYRFVKWESGDVTIADGKFTMPRKPVTVTAVWEIVKHTVAFESNGGSIVASQTVDYGSAAARPSAPSKTGYDFGGWYTDKDCTAAYDFAKAVTGDVTLYAKWTAKQYIVSFDINGGKTPAPGSITVTYNKAYGTLPIATHSNLYFTGWYTAASGGTRVYATSICKVDGNQTLYAHWSTVPPTGDDVSAVQVTALCGMLTLSLAGLAGVLVYRKRRTE